MKATRIVSVRKGSHEKGFSLIELMVAMGILSVLMLMMTVLLDQIQKSWRYSESRISQFREARVAFDLITKNVSQASLNTYWDLDDKDSDGLVDEYYRTSELHFITMPADRLAGAAGSQNPVGHAVFFQAPLGFSNSYRNLNNLFNGRGYFVAFGSDQEFRPRFLDSRDPRPAYRHRYRLMEFRPPAESNQVFADGDEERKQGEPQEFTEWFKQGLQVGNGSFESHLNPLAENIVYLVISPRDSLESGESRDASYSDIAPLYQYDSNDQRDEFSSFAQQVPPLVRITMVAIDEDSAVRLENGSQMPTFVKGTYFQDTREFEDDVANLSKELEQGTYPSGGANKIPVNFKIFSSMVMLRSAKWGTN
ncbi:MAG: Verru_Chthon cassette protein C [Verrucomicrobiota bacterium]